MSEFKVKERNRQYYYGVLKQLSDELCACGCGQRITVRAARRKAKGLTEGYVKGHNWKGKKLPLEARIKMSLNHADVRGEKNPNYGKGLHGEKNPNWQGGKTKTLYIKNNQPNIATKKDRLLKKLIKEVDGKCVLCGNVSRLEAHHIIPVVEAMDRQFDPTNMITLCKPCHVRADNKHHKDQIRPMLEAYVKQVRTEEQVNFIKEEMTKQGVPI